MPHLSHLETSHGSTVNSLTEKNLRLIISYTSMLDPPAINSENKVYMGWLSTTHVSRLWRETALTCDVLWTRILLNLGRDWVATMIERAGSAHLLSFTMHDCEWDDVLRTTFDETVPAVMNRVQHLELYGNPDDFDHVDEVLASRKAPALTYLRLTRNIFAANGNLLDTNLSEDILAGHIPLLETLILDGVGFASESFYVFPNLKHLEISSYGNDSDGVPGTPGDLIDALARMPLLEVLSLTGAVINEWIGEEDTYEDTIETEPANLPNLRTLTMEGSEYALDVLRRHIVTPTSCVITLHERDFC